MTTTPLTIRILAVDPGARYMGVAILVGDDLIRADVENIRDAGMTAEEVARQAQRIVGRWIGHYRPDVLAVELPEFAQSKKSRQLRRLVRAVVVTGRKAGLEVRTYVPTTVRRRTCLYGRPTRLAVARVMAERFPWLAPYYRKEAGKSWWRKPYWLSLFDAIAVGLVCHDELTRPRSGRKAA